MQNHSTQTFSAMTSVAGVWIKKHSVLGIMEDAVHYVRAHILLFVVLAIALNTVISWIQKSLSLAHIPRVYYRDATWLDRWTDVFRIMIHGKEAAIKGYKTFPNSFFQVKLLNKLFIVADRASLKEYFDAPEDSLSFRTETADLLALRYTFHERMAWDDYHVPLIRKQLTQNIAALMPAIMEEMKIAFTAEIPITDDWTPFNVWEKCLSVVCRITTRAFVGVPVCRNEEYLEYAVRHATAVSQTGFLLHFIPEYFKRLVVHLLFRDLSRGHKVAYKNIVPVIHHRRTHENDKDYKKPNDFLQWLMDTAVGIEATDDYLVSRILVLNFASVHTTTLTYTHAIYDLAVHTEFHAELREEIESLVGEEGWKKSTVMKMRKLDSFLKESTRIHSLGPVGSSRRVLKPYTFANGTTLPAGVSINVPLAPTHLNESIYPNATEFDPLRFYRARQQNGENARYYTANTSNEYMHFGHGQHACPGRFFAVNEVKLMLAWTLLHYDFKTADGIRPKDFAFEQFSAPDMKAEILFKRRS